MCNNCHQNDCCCPPPMPPCFGCIEPDMYPVPHVPAPNVCQDLVDTIKDIIGVQPACKLKFGPVTVIVNSVTLVGLFPSGTMEYSADGVLWQDSPTFNNQLAGTRKYYIRERSNPACAVAGWATIAGCNSNWQNTATPPLPLCINGFINHYQTDGCNNFRWNPTQTPCNTGCVPGATVDVSPQVSECLPSGFLRIQTTDGCSFGWRLTNTPCGTTPCVTPAGPATVSATPATCNQAGQIQNNGSFSYGPVTNGNRYALYLPGTDATPTYAQAITIPSNGMIAVNNIPGSSSAKVFRLVIFNQNDSCKLEKDVSVAATVCQPSCVLPVFTLDSVDSTCTNNVSNNDGKLRISGLSNGDRVQICEAATFTCTPNYATAAPISGSTPVFIKSNVGFASTEQYKDFSVRVYNGNVECQVTKIVRVYNPCFESGCTFPGNGTPVINQATCNGATPNNDATIAIGNVVNATKFGFSYGTTYTGPAYAAATTISGGTISIAQLTGSVNDMPVSIRLFNGNDNCHKDILAIVPGKSCGTACVNPSFTIGSLAPTCSNGQSNENGNVSINNIANGNRYQLCNAATFNCEPNYGAAVPFTGVGPFLVVPNLGFLSTQQYKDFTVRVYNGSVGCFADRTLRVMNPCYSNDCCNLVINNIQLTNG